LARYSEAFGFEGLTLHLARALAQQSHLMRLQGDGSDLRRSICAESACSGSRRPAPPGGWLDQLHCCHGATATKGFSEPVVELFDVIDEIITELEDAFGRAELGVNFNWNKRGQPYDPETGRLIPKDWIQFPAVNYGCGSSWAREKWPKELGMSLVPHPFDRNANLLAEESLVL
jgi:hypothetical protein